MTNNTEDVTRLRAKVARKTTWKKIPDYWLLSGVLLFCGVISGINFLPYAKKPLTLTASEKQNTDQTLSQNMALLARLKETSLQKQDAPPPKLKHHETISKELLARMNAPSTFYVDNHTVVTKKGAHATFTGTDGNSDFLNQQDDITSVSAKRLPHPTLTVPAGEMIPATLETAIHSDLAGMVRAVVTHDVYSLEGHRVLIQKGATLVGQFNAAINQGQSRVFVVWNRVQMTNGVIATLHSASTDVIGRSGQAADTIDRHFFERFGSSALLSVIGAYAATGGVNGEDEYNSAAQYRMNTANHFQQTAHQTLMNDKQVSPTLQVHQGTSITVFVAHDLDFYEVITA